MRKEMRIELIPKYQEVYITLNNLNETKELIKRLTESIKILEEDKNILDWNFKIPIINNELQNDNFVIFRTINK